MSSQQPVLDTLIQAMINEQDGRDFYLAASDIVSDEMGRAMCQGLARDELEHLHILQAQYTRVSQGETFIDLKSAREEKPLPEDLKLFPDKTNLPDMLRAARNDEQVLKVALHFEQKGYEMYTQAAKTAGTPAEREVFAYLADQENHHYVGLQKTLDYLQNNGTWFFDDIEHPFFEG